MRAACLLAALALGLAGFRLFGDEAAGNRAYRAGDYEKAARLYREALAAGRDDPRLRYNLGTALLRIGEADGARENLTKALAARSPELRARAFYQLGNALAAARGAATTESDLRAAIDAYRRSLLLEPDRADARWNLELALQRLEKLESTPQTDAQSPAADSNQGEGGGSPQRPEGSGAESPLPARGSGGEGVAPGRTDASTPLPLALAEQILRAVEEQERSLQRETLRRSKRRVTGPDW